LEGETKMKMHLVTNNLMKGHVHCPICTHTVPANINIAGKYPRVAGGQKCPRCQSSLDVAVVVQVLEAA
jgi:hypothetical protein